LFLFIGVALLFFFQIGCLSNLFLSISFLFLSFQYCSWNEIRDLSYFSLLIVGKEKLSITSIPIIIRSQMVFGWPELKYLSWLIIQKISIIFLLFIFIVL